MSVEAYKSQVLNNTDNVHTCLYVATLCYHGY